MTQGSRIPEPRPLPGESVKARRAAARPRRGFTLMELLVVIGIISILVALTLAVGAKVSGSGKERATLNAIQIMETSMHAMTQATDSMPSPVYQYENPGVSGQYVLQPIADARAGGTVEMLNSVGWYMKQAENVPSVAPIFKGIDERLLKSVDFSVVQGGNWQTDQPMMPTVHDGWGNPLRYVHPSFDGLIYHNQQYMNGKIFDYLDPVGIAADNANQANPFGLKVAAPLEYGFKFIRRNGPPPAGDAKWQNTPLTQRDSDGGICPGNTPYFYSAGPDGDPWTTDDNVYSVRPEIQMQAP